MDHADRKRRIREAYAAARDAEAAELEGWRPGALCDGWSSDGKMLHWETYTHPDGREVHVFDGIYCSDPELQALLQARANEMEEELQPPWRWSASTLLLRLVRALAVRALPRWRQG